MGIVYLTIIWEVIDLLYPLSGKQEIKQCSDRKASLALSQSSTAVGKYWKGDIWGSCNSQQTVKAAEGGMQGQQWWVVRKSVRLVCESWPPKVKHLFKNFGNTEHSLNSLRSSSVWLDRKEVLPHLFVMCNVSRIWIFFSIKPGPLCNSMWLCFAGNILV